MKDPAKEQSMTVQLPAPTDNLEVDFVYQTIDVPFYENFVCSMTYNASVKNASSFPSANLSTLQSCGNMPVYKWMSGTYKETGDYTPVNVKTKTAGPCSGSDWTVDLSRSGIKVNEENDNYGVEVRCTFKRSFAKGSMREIKFDENIQWMAGYNMYYHKDSVFRHQYGYSYESDKRNLAGPILAEASRQEVAVAAAALAVLTLLI